MFSEREIRFLLGRHTTETTTGTRETREMTDLRNLGCPESVFNRVLSHRALKLGKMFAEFRNANSSTSAPNNSLDEAISSAKLF
jgi:hypothetical protein